MELFKLFGTIAINNQDAIDGITQTTKSAEGSQSKMVSAFKKIGTAVVSYLAVDKIKDFGLSMIEASANAQAMASQFTQVFGDMEGQATESLSAIAEETGVLENRMKGSYTKIASFAKTSGMDTADALDLANRSMIAIADSSAFYDRTLEETTESLQSFLKGNYENDSALGISCTETTRNAKANELYGQSFNDLSEAQKQLTLLAMVEEANALSGAMGQASRESETWTNQTGNLKQAWTDMLAVLGEPVLQLVVPMITKIAEGISGLTEKFKEGNNPIETFQSKIATLKGWFQNIAEYASDKLEPIISNLKESFTAVKDALQPYIDKLAEYVTSGELVEDITNNIKECIDLVVEGYETLCGWIESVVGWFESASTWLTQHETELQMVAIAVGTLTTAIIAYNVAQGIKNAGGIVELAQLALLQVQIWGLTIAENAHTVATTIATGATTAFGVAVNFLTSPITLVILAIGALIAIGVLLAKNWDEIKAKATEIFQAISDWVSKKFEEVKQFFSDLASSAKAKLEEIKQFFVDAKTKITETFQNIGQWFGDRLSDIKNVFSGIGSWFSEKFQSAYNSITNIFSGLGTFFSNVWNKITGIFKNVGTTIGDAISGAVKGAVNKVLSGASNIINGFISAINFAIDVINAIPGVSISKLSELEVPQLAEGGILEKGEIGLLEGNGAEAVVPLHNNKKWISAVAEDMDSAMGGKSSEKLDKVVKLLEQLVEFMPELANISIILNNREFGRAVRQVNV